MRDVIAVRTAPDGLLHIVTPDGLTAFDGKGSVAATIAARDARGLFLDTAGAPIVRVFAAWRGNDNFLRPGDEVAFGLFGIRKQTGRFNHQLHP